MAARFPPPRLRRRVRNLPRPPDCHPSPAPTAMRRRQVAGGGLLSCPSPSQGVRKRGAVRSGRGSGQLVNKTVRGMTTSRSSSSGCKCNTSVTDRDEWRMGGGCCVACGSDCASAPLRDVERVCVRLHTHRQRWLSCTWM